MPLDVSPPPGADPAGLYAPVRSVIMRCRQPCSPRIPFERARISMHPPVLKAAEKLIKLAFEEDLDSGTDVTSETLIPKSHRATYQVVARESGVVCGTELASLIVDRFEADARVWVNKRDGDRVQPGDVALELKGRTRDLLKVERTILNFMGRLSGVASLTARFVDRTQGTRAKILDTRKTTPGWRHLEKYAVRCGGGTNHRMGLFDAVLIKDNHLAAISNVDDGSTWSHKLAAAIQTIREQNPEMPIEVEVDTLEQLRTVLPLRPNQVLLDNMPTEQLKQAVRIRGESIQPDLEPVLLEASGGVNLDTVASIAQTGVDRISVGALTHSAVNFDWGMDWIDRTDINSAQ